MSTPQCLSLTRMIKHFPKNYEFQKNYFEIILTEQSIVPRLSSIRKYKTMALQFTYKRSEIIKETIKTEDNRALLYKSHNKDTVANHVLVLCA